jgi:methylglutaconyl-CoA hydratase
VNYSVAQNSSGDAAYLKSLEVAQQILPNGPIAIKMAKAAINKGMQVTITFKFGYRFQI